VVDELPTEVFRLLVGERKAMTFKAGPEDYGSGSEEYELLAQPEEEGEDGGPAARHVDRQLQTNLPSAKLQSRLLKTDHDARVFIEEQGVNILYLALGMLRWFESGSSQEPRRAPLILVPVTMERSNVRERFRLMYTEEAHTDWLLHLDQFPSPDTASAEVLVTYINSVWNDASERPFIGEDGNLKRGWHCDSLLEAMGIMLLLDMTEDSTIKKCESRGCTNYFRVGSQSKSKYCSKKCANRASTRKGRGQEP
jgi:hypothetical protein